MLVAFRPSEGSVLGSGWGNYMQDMLMNAYLTYATGRT